MHKLHAANVRGRVICTPVVCLGGGALAHVWQYDVSGGKWCAAATSQLQGRHDHITLPLCLWRHTFDPRITRITGPRSSRSRTCRMRLTAFWPRRGRRGGSHPARPPLWLAMNRSAHTLDVMVLAVASFTELQSVMTQSCCRITVPHAENVKSDQRLVGRHVLIDATLRLACSAAEAKCAVTQEPECMRHTVAKPKGRLQASQRPCHVSLAKARTHACITHHTVHISRHVCTHRVSHFTRSSHIPHAPFASHITHIMWPHPHRPRTSCSQRLMMRRNCCRTAAAMHCWTARRCVYHITSHHVTSYHIMYCYILLAAVIWS